MVDLGFNPTDLLIIIIGVILAGAIISVEILLYIKMRKRDREFRSFYTQRDKELKKITGES